jgi:hypothetical protein
LRRIRGTERDDAVTGFRLVRWRALVAALAGAALVLQAALASFAPLGVAAAVDELAAHALCFGSGRTDQDAPPPGTDRGRQACCILCVVPGFAAPADPAGLAAPGLFAPLAAPLQAMAAARFVAPSELSPIRARAPPAA